MKRYKIEVVYVDDENEQEDEQEDEELDTISKFDVDSENI